MALRTPPSWLQNGSHPAENDRLSTQALYATTGIIGTNSLAVTQNSTPGMSVFVASGWAAIVGTTQVNMGTYVGYNDAQVTLAIAVSPVANSRIDLVVMTVNDAFYTGALNSVVLTVVTGTAAATPVAPTTPANSIALAQILVGASVTSILTANITDVRVNTTTNLPVLTAAGTATLTNKTLSSGILTGTLTAAGSVGTAGQVLSSTATGVQWTSVGAGYSAPTLGTTSIGSGATVPSIAGLTKLTTVQYTSTDGNGYEVDNVLMNLMGAY
jgi:hypothetical protein